MITILLAAYNGASYLAEQIDSLMWQTVPADRVVVQDDGSTDGSWDLLEEFRKRYPEQLILFRNGQNSGSPKYNFYSMMSRFRDDYILLCDQDDVWKPDKIERTLEKLKEMEEAYGRETPLLAHTDLVVTDRELNILHPSFRKAMNANYDRVQLRDQIIQNTLTGCTAMYNRALAEYLREAEPEYMVMHDWWLMLAASAFGHIGHVDEQTVLYRQHGGNEVGAKDMRSVKYKLRMLFRGQEIREALSNTCRQADSFLEYYRKDLEREQIELLEVYRRIPQMRKWDRWRTISRLGTVKNGAARKIANFLFI